MHVGGRRRRFAIAERSEIVLDALETIAGDVLVDAENHEGNQGGEGPELGAIGEFCFGFPAEEPARDFESDEQAESKGDEIREDFGGGGGVSGGGLEPVSQIGGGHEQSGALNPVREDGERDAGARKKEEAGPDELVDDLRFLHGVGDARNDQAASGGSGRSNRNEQKRPPEISPAWHVQRPFAG